MPGKGEPSVLLMWLVNGSFIWSNKLSDRIHVTKRRSELHRHFKSMFLLCTDNLCHRKYAHLVSLVFLLFLVSRPWHQKADHDKNEGVWLETALVFNEVMETDLYTNYTCQAHSARGIPKAYFTLLPEGETSAESRKKMLQTLIY